LREKEKRASHLDSEERGGGYNNTSEIPINKDGEVASLYWLS
jgi:hypothetical protein